MELFLFQPVGFNKSIHIEYHILMLISDVGLSPRVLARAEITRGSIPGTRSALKWGSVYIKQVDKQLIFGGGDPP